MVHKLQYKTGDLQKFYNAITQGYFFFYMDRVNVSISAWHHSAKAGLFSRQWSRHMMTLAQPYQIWRFCCWGTGLAKQKEAP